MNIVQAIRDVDSVLIDINNIVVEAIMENEAEIIGLNISQLSEGFGASGNKLPEYESDEYFSAKKAQGLIEGAGRNYNLLLEGDFRSGFFIEKTGDQAWMDSKDDKTRRLEDLTNVDIFGIMPKNIPELLRLIFPALKRIILNKIMK